MRYMMALLFVFSFCGCGPVDSDDCDTLTCDTKWPDDKGQRDKCLAALCPLQ